MNEGDVGLERGGGEEKRKVMVFFPKFKEEYLGK